MSSRQPLRLPTDCDLSEEAVEDAAALLGVMPCETTLFCANVDAGVAQKIARELACKVILLPAELLRSPDHWAVMDGHRAVVGGLL